MTCPNCGFEALSPFYAARGVPAHSCLLMDTPAEAKAYPRADVELGYCGACDFIANVRFDPALKQYGPRYEETQHFSPRFDAWARGLAERLVDDFGVRGKRVVEIGCGKGEFLHLLCCQGENTGIGIDPGCEPERLRCDRVSFIQDYYGEQHHDLEADVICCRHTLEHIQSPREFVADLRRAIGDRKDTLVFFEVPDVTRILHECAFWDIYYEHCSYFAPGSLVRLFRESGFRILDTARDYDDQYVWIMAQPGSGNHVPPLEDVAGAVESFEDSCAAIQEGWRRRIHSLRRPVIWGGGSRCVSFLSTLGLTDEIAAVVDINPYKQGKYLPGTGHEIVAPSDLKDVEPREVVVLNPIYCEEIGEEIARVGVDAEVIPV